MEPITSSVSSLAPIPVRATVGAALQFIRAEWKPLLRIALVPGSIVGALQMLLMLLTPEHPSPPGTFDVNALVLILELLLLFIVQSFVVSWQVVSTMRFVGLGEQSQQWFPAFPPTLWSYMWRMFLLSLISCVCIIPIALAGGIVYAGFHSRTILILLLICAVPFWLAVLIRLGLTPVAAAVGEDKHFMMAWRRTKGQTLRICGVKFLAALAGMLVVLASGLLTLFIGLLSKTLAAIIGGTVTNITMVTLWSVISILLLRYFYQQTPDKLQETDGDHVL